MKINDQNNSSDFLRPFLGFPMTASLFIILGYKHFLFFILSIFIFSLWYIIYIIKNEKTRKLWNDKYSIRIMIYSFLLVGFVGFSGSFLFNSSSWGEIAIFIMFCMILVFFPLIYNLEKEIKREQKVD